MQKERHGSVCMLSSVNLRIERENLLRGIFLISQFFEDLHNVLKTIPNIFEKLPIFVYLKTILKKVISPWVAASSRGGRGRGGGCRRGSWTR